MILLTTAYAFGQDSLLVFESYLELVKKHHPITYRADIIVNLAEAKVLKARGAFDPKLEFGYDKKEFNDSNYFSLLNSGLNIPLWFGSDLKFRFDRNNGIYLNNSDFVPEQGLLGPGIELALGRGLLTDERRATLQKAKLMRQNSEFERSIAMNELIYKASMAYFYFQEASQIEGLLYESVQLAETRLNITREAYLNGYNPAIDTLEAQINLQNREQRLIDAQQARINSRLNLGNFMWFNGQNPVETAEFIKPEILDIQNWQFTIDSLSSLEDEILAQHPKALSFDNKQDQLNVDMKLNREMLKPDLTLGYSPLVDFDNQIDNGSLFMDNYKLGASFSYPIFTRKERAELRMTDLKIEDLGFERTTALQQLSLKAEILRNSIRMLKEQYTQIQNIRQNSKSLLDAENLKFSIGESSVFLVNSREQKYIEAREKEIIIQQKILKAISEYLYTLNKMPLL